jgi:uncharacterized protein involved in tellurium resistance
VFSGFQGGDGVGGVVGDGGIDMNGIDLGDRRGDRRSPCSVFNAVFVADRVELGLGALADGGQFGVRMALVNGNEFGAEAETDDCDVWFGCGHD